MVRHWDLRSAGLLPTSMERDRQTEGERQRGRAGDTEGQRELGSAGLLSSLWRETDGQNWWRVGVGEGERGKESILGWRGLVNTQEIGLK